MSRRDIERWEDDDVVLLHKLAEAGETVAEIARRMVRTERSIRSKAERLKISFRALRER
jgi:hypothetical protein